MRVKLRKGEEWQEKRLECLGYCFGGDDGGPSGGTDDPSVDTNGLTSQEQAAVDAGQNPGAPGSPGGVGPGTNGNEFNGLNGLNTVDQTTQQGWDQSVAAQQAQEAADAAAGRGSGYDLGAALGFGPSRSQYVDDASYNAALSEAGLNANYGATQGQGTGVSTNYNTDLSGHAINTGLGPVGTWMSENPGLTGLANSLTYAVNPLAGLGASLFTGYETGHGGRAGGSAIGGLAGPGGAALGSVLGGLYDDPSGRSTVAGLSNAGLSELLSSLGLSLGQVGYDFAGPAGGVIGSSLQGQALSGFGNSVASALSANGSSNPGEGTGGGSQQDLSIPTGYTADNILSASAGGPSQSTGTSSTLPSRQTSPISSVDSIFPSGKEGERQNVWNQSSLRTKDEGVSNVS